MIRARRMRTTRHHPVIDHARVNGAAAVLIGRSVWRLYRGGWQLRAGQPRRR